MCCDLTAGGWWGGVQTRMMAQRKSPEGIQYSSFFDALLKIPRQEGFLALYKVPHPYRQLPCALSHPTWSSNTSNACALRFDVCPSYYDAAITLCGQV